MQTASRLNPVLLGLCAVESPLAATRRRIVVAGGGTGGHLFPGITIAGEFMHRNSANAVLFVSTGNAFERKALARAGFALKAVRIEGIKGKSVLKKCKAALLIPRSIISARRILKDFRPDLVVGVGSYAAGPVVFAAWLAGIPCVLHEQNRLPGLTNRILARFATRIYVSFENTVADFDPQRVRFTGNPVREDILKIAAAPRPTAADSNETGGPGLNILIIGGSQGAHRINQAVVEALNHLNAPEHYRFIHQTGAADADWVADAYERRGIQAEVRPFFEDMDRQYQRADLMICRAGATTVAEVTAIGKAVLFVPFPFAADDHQVLNARMLQESGAAEMIEEKDLDGARLAERLRHYADNRSALQRMAQKAGSFGKPDAAKVIVDDMYALMQA
jgi:UDP-N-acetylglucosamine--N-acetylmuramyl-(pentapeptide) pyrophosphoryl-undecaprenol N-acetylglucosamine transferase